MMKTSKSLAMFAKVDEWKNSGQTIRSFASTIGISKSTLEYWVRKKREAFANSPAFVQLSPVVKTKVSVEASSKRPDTDAQPKLVITFAGGMCVKVYG